MKHTYKKVVDLQNNVRADVIVRIEDNAIIPTDPNNYDYKVYLAWVAEGNEALVSE